MQAREDDHIINPTFMSYPIIEFTEVNISEKKNSRFDITKSDIESHMAEIKCSFMAAYNEILLRRLSDYGKSEKKEFIIYHLEGISDKKEWLFSFEKLVKSRVDSDNDLSTMVWQKDLKGVEEISEDLIKKINSSTSDKIVRKIQTELTVPQLGYLLRAFFEEGIFTPKQKSDLIKVFSENFSSKSRKDISAKSLRNSFDSPALKEIDELQEIFTHLMQRAKKDKEK
ncbi:hypothetical protein PZB74_12315 [Porifericola rhodea]|uniref:hypothetical protein n=1 Tax=Porifericola rhodea TaxID=930972 RepID=UPI0026652C15|nr:hypothetical protein [Porifericola rhodea]WKN29750.1 hypothetical protein PZB74_12315 [Porifericola rhodea]